METYLEAKSKLTYETKINELQTALKVILAEKEEFFEQLTNKTADVTLSSLGFELLSGDWIFISYLPCLTS